MNIPEDLLAYCEYDPTFIQLRDKAETLYTQVTNGNFLIEGHVFPWRTYLMREVVELVVNDIQESAKHWRGHAVQGLQLVYPGFASNPFGTDAVVSGFARCDDTLQATGGLFSHTGRLDLQNYFAEIDSLVTHFPKLRSVMQDYMCHLALMYVHIGMSIYAQSDDFKSLSLVYPLYVFGNAHGSEPVLIFKRTTRDA